MRNNNRPWLIAGILSAVLAMLLPKAGWAAVSYQYRLLERIPGFPVSSGTGQFSQYIGAIYKFGIWTVGLSALFMTIIGGFMYMTSAGNTARIGAAKSVITSALAGLAVAMFAYLILYIINPELVRINLDSVSRPPQ